MSDEQEMKPVASDSRKAPRDWWKLKKSQIVKDAGSELAAVTRVNVAVMLKGWPNADLDPTHAITEAEFDAALDKAKEY